MTVRAWDENGSLSWRSRSLMRAGIASAIAPHGMLLRQGHAEVRAILSDAPF
jgi:hypothetical protein